MIIKGLKSGDVFEESGSLYKIDSVVGENYISHRIRDDELNTVAEEVADEPSVTEKVEVEEVADEPKAAAKKSSQNKRGQ